MLLSAPHPRSTSSIDSVASDMDWSHDYCLSCDKQTPEGAYCSQACRLADLEKAGASEPPSPLNYARSTSAATWPSSPGGFYLPPAVNFAAYRSISAPTSPGVMPAGQSCYFTSQPPKRALSTSSSRSSLSSISGHSTTQGLSSQARTQLRSYVSSFDQVRDLRRRLTLN